MRKITYANVTCDVSVNENYTFSSELPCEYERDVIAYATERFLCRFDKFKKDFTKECWKIRVAERKKSKKFKFHYIVPATLMELPGNWVRIKGEVNAVGANVLSVELLKNHPMLR